MTPEPRAAIAGQPSEDSAPASLDEHGYATLGSLLSAKECAALIACYDEESHFRSRVIMARHSFGQGEYKYFAAPLPPVVQDLRERLYERLVPIANRWRRDLGAEPIFPPTLVEFRVNCHEAGQDQPTPLILRYREGDYNCLHQDLYGEMAFPLQVAVLLNQPGEDFTGGELVLTEQRPRRQSRAEVITLQRGEAVVFAVNERPVLGGRGYYRVKHRHGVSRVRSGTRHVLGIIFHDAR